MSEATGESPSWLMLSPSDNHTLLADQLRPSLRYPGSRIQEWKETLRSKLRDLIGLPTNDYVPLDPRVLWEDEDGDGSITKVAFRAEPHADVIAYWCVPHGAEAPYRTVICLQGHSTGAHNSISRDRDNIRKHIDVPGDRNFASSAMRSGYAALCVEQRAFGERSEEGISPSKVSEGCHQPAVRALLLGRTLIGERVFDVERSIDYLEERGDVDMSRVGVMGNSGGGTVTIYSSALLNRLAFAMPSCSLATFRGSIMSVHHCICNYVPGILRWADMGDILAMFAPKPLVVVAGRDDRIFPLSSVLEAFEVVHQAYKDLNAEDRCALIVGDGGHRFYADASWTKMRSLLED